MSTAWEETFAPEPVPEWLLAFDSSPVQAVDALLGRRFYFGSLNAADPEELLVDWALLLSGKGFVGRLDEALSMWVEQNWGVFPDGVTAARLADTWSRLCTVVACLEDLPRTAGALRDRFDDREEFLGPLSVGPSRDPLGRYLAAVARFQPNLSLAPFWWTLCDLPDGVPFYHAPYAIAGLLGLPPLDKNQEGGFQEQVAHGVVRLAKALLRRVEKQEMQKNRARDEWLWTTRLAMARLPFPERWRKVFEEALHRRVSDDCRAWLETVFSKLNPTLVVRKNFDTYSWADSAKAVAQALRRGRAEAQERARELLLTQEQYARHFGDSSFLVKSLCNFAAAVWDRNPLLAIQWAGVAKMWEPQNSYTWSTLIQARLRSDGAGAALPLAWEAEERFPEDAVTRNGLAEVLRQSGRLEEAEAVYRQAVADFPTDTYTRNGLAEVLRQSGRLEEAEAIYRQAVADFPTATNACNGLAEVLKESGYLEEAEAVYRQAVADFPTNIYARNGLAEVLKESGYLEEAEVVYRQAVVDFPADTYARNGLAEVLKESGRLEEAEAAYRQVVADFPGNTVAPVGLAAVLRLRGAEYYHEALTLIERVLRQGRNQAAALAEKGRLLEAMGNLFEAAEAFEASRSAERSPTTKAENASTQSLEGLERTSVPIPDRVPSSPTALQDSKREGIPHTDSASLKVGSTTSRPRVSISEEGKVNRAAPRLSRSEQAAWTGEARFLRIWARRGGDPEHGRYPEELRQQAEDLLGRLLRAKPHDSKALAERGLLWLDWGRYEDARVLLCKSLERLPGKPVLLAAMARLEREQARVRSLSLGDKTLAEVFEAPDRLRALGGGFEPLVLLQRGRAVLALQDGQVRRDLAAQNFNRLHRWIRPHLQTVHDGFEGWWSRRLNEEVFLPIPIESDVRPDDVDILSERIEARAPQIDALDEAFGLRKDPRTASFLPLVV